MTVFDSCNLSYLTVKRLWSYSFIGGKGAIALENRGWKEEGGRAGRCRLSAGTVVVFVAAEERSEAAIGGAAVVKSASQFNQANCVLRFNDRYAADRSLRQRLQKRAGGECVAA